MIDATSAAQRRATFGSAALLCLVLGGVAPAGAQPATSSLPSLSISGYGSVGMLHSSEREADYIVDVFKPGGAGHSRAVSFDADSRLGLQMDAQLTPRLSATVQVISEQRYDNTYTPKVEWANLKYRIMPDLAIKAGRVVLPIFMVTDSRRVGYANPWARPPVEMYGLVPVTHNDGVDVIWRSAAGAMTNVLQITAGQSKTRFPTSSGAVGLVDVRRIVSVNDAIEFGAATVRAIYGRASLTIDTFDPLIDPFRQFGAQGNAIADRYQLKDRRVSFIGAGASYDPGPWFVMSEAASFETDSLLGTRRSWYVSGGARFAKWTPYATFARISGSPTSDPGLTVTGLPPNVAPVAIALNAALNRQLNLQPRQHTTSVGVRWDAFKNAAVKLQLDWVRTGSGSTGTFGNIQPSFRPGSSSRVTSAVVDFVF